MTQQSNFSGNPTNDQWQKGQAGIVQPLKLAQHALRNILAGTKFLAKSPTFNRAPTGRAVDREKFYRKNWVAWKNGTLRRPSKG